MLATPTIVPPDVTCSVTATHTLILVASKLRSHCPHCSWIIFTTHALAARELINSKYLTGSMYANFLIINGYLPLGLLDYHVYVRVNSDCFMPARGLVHGNKL